jgi:hypothetical protein
LYPWIDLLERVALGFEREEAPQQKLRKLEGFVVQYGLPLAEATYRKFKRTFCYHGAAKRCVPHVPSFSRGNIFLVY